MSNLSSKWSDFERKVFSRADVLTGNLPEHWTPIPLAEIARQQRVKRIVFCELPVDGGLAVEEDGFVIYVHCPDNVSTLWTASIADSRDGGRSLPSKARFTIAHEIAHTVLYDFRSRRPRALVRGRTPNELQSLERTCNRGAGRLLIPDRLLRAATTDTVCIDAAALKKLTERFRVSAEALVNRLTHCGLWGEMGGGAYFVREQKPGTLLIRAAAADGQTRALFPFAKYGEDPLHAFRSCSIAFDGVPIESRLIGIPTSVGTRLTTQACSVSVEPVTPKPRSFLLTIHPRGGPRLRSDAKHGYASSPPSP